jgi:Zn-dependent peptidase ImmA (M78 family)
MGLRKKIIRKMVNDLLSQAEVNVPPVPLDKIAGNLNLRLRFQPYDGELSGCIVRKDGNAIIGINSSHHENRQRFTLAHEIGHYLLHKGEEMFIDRDFRVNLRNAHSGKAENLEEIEANQFAAELLMPASLLSDELKGKAFDLEDGSMIRKLAIRYKVSSQALSYRLVNLGYLNPYAK